MCIRDSQCTTMKQFLAERSIANLRGQRTGAAVRAALKYILRDDRRPVQPSTSLAAPSPSLGLPWSIRPNVLHNKWDRPLLEHGVLIGSTNFLNTVGNNQGGRRYFPRCEITALVSGPGNMAVYGHILVIPPTAKGLPPKNEKPPTAKT